MMKQMGAEFSLTETGEYVLFSDIARYLKIKINIKGRILKVK